MVFAAVADGWGSFVKVGPFAGIGQVAGATRNYAGPRNTTIYGVDATTGEMEWRFFIDGVAFRGGVITSGGVVYAPAGDGFVYMLDADTGELLDRLFMGVALGAQGSMGKTSNGETRLLQSNGVGFTGGGLGPAGLSTAVSGSIMAFGLPDEIQESPEVVEARAAEAEAEARADQLEERVAVLEQQLDEAAAVAISPISYVVIGVGVVLVVIAGVLFTRRRSA